METLFGLELVTSEFTLGKFRLDSLCFDFENNAFVIVEYKKGSSYSVIDQGYSYLSLMLNNKADFVSHTPVVGFVIRHRRPGQVAQRT